MPEHLRALLFILLLSTAFFAVAGRPAALVIGQGNFFRRRNLWFALTISGFLVGSFWLYTFIAISLLLYANRHENNPPALFFFILFALPVAFINVPGMGLINYLLSLSHARILAMFILLPAFFTLIRHGGSMRFGRVFSDKVLAAYLLLIAIHYLRETTETDTLRQTLYLFLDIFLPYFVISRSLKDLQSFRDAMLSMVLAIMLLALIAIYEAYGHWLLYQPMLDALELEEGMTGYLGRDSMLRVSAAAGHPIALGYLMVVGIGFYLFLQRSLQSNLIRRIGMVLLAAGLIVPLSRGPWVGAAMLLIVFIATGRKAALRLMGGGMIGVLSLALVATLPGGSRVINLLPFIGTTEKSNIDYRMNLLTNSITVIQRNPWFGSISFMKTPEMEELREGGIIDVVNSYVRLALETGIVGLGLFVSFFVFVVTDVYRTMRSLPNKDSEEHLLGRAILATLLAILVIIFTVSSVTVIPIVYWSVAGLGVAYAQMVRRQIDNPQI